MLTDFFALAESAGLADDEATQEKVGRVLARRMVRDRLVDHVSHGVRDGSLPPAAGTIIRLFHSDVTFLEVDTAMDIAGGSGVVDDDTDLFKVGERYLSRQTVALGGGSNEMARDVIGERVLGFPREYAADRGVPFNQVKHNERAQAVDSAPAERASRTLRRGRRINAAQLSVLRACRWLCAAPI